MHLTEEKKEPKAQHYCSLVNYENCDNRRALLAVHMTLEEWWCFLMGAEHPFMFLDQHILPEDECLAST